jgi:hypothetical protein
MAKQLRTGSGGQMKKENHGRPKHGSVWVPDQISKQDKARQSKTKQDKARQSKTKQDKARK